jgi:hypothetical protein
LEIISLLKKRNRKLKTRHVSLFEKRETEKLTTLYSFVKKSFKLFLFPKETKHSNGTCNLLLFSIKEKQKIIAI